MSEPDAHDPAQALEMQDRLRREADHRLKNNLQLISSIILLQSRRAADDAARQALRDVLQRVTAVSVTHRHVVIEGAHEKMDVAALLRELAADLAAGSGREGIAVELDLEPLQAPARDGAPLALWFSEALGNALRHAFPEGRSGRVTVGLRREPGGFVLSVTDDGVGAPPAGSKPGFGTTIITLLAQQLRARLETDPAQPGYRVAVHVPVNEAAS